MSLSVIGTLDSEQIEAVLRERPVGRLAVHADGRTYVLPVSYAYDGEAIYIHSSEGLKLRMMRAAPEVCFQVDDVDVNDMANWRSVVAWGTFEELHGAAAAAAMDLLAAKLRPAHRERDRRAIRTQPRTRRPWRHRVSHRAEGADRTFRVGLGAPERFRLDSSITPRRARYSFVPAVA